MSTIKKKKWYSSKKNKKTLANTSPDIEVDEDILFLNNIKLDHNCHNIDYKKSISDKIHICIKNVDLDKMIEIIKKKPGLINHKMKHGLTPVQILILTNMEKDAIWALETKPNLGTMCFDKYDTIDIIRISNLHSRYYGLWPNAINSLVKSGIKYKQIDPCYENLVVAFKNGFPDICLDILNDPISHSKIRQNIVYITTNIVRNIKNGRDLDYVFDKLVDIADPKSILPDKVFYVISEKYFLKGMEKDKIKLSSECILHAALSNKIKIVEKLLIKNISPNFRSNYGETAIFYAIKNNNEKMLEMLIKAGADKNGTDPVGRKYDELIIDRLGYVNLLEYLKLDSDQDFIRSLDPNAFECPICYEFNNSKVHLQPCGHGPYCPKCAGIFLGDVCPHCKKNVENVLTIFSVI